MTEFTIHPMVVGLNRTYKCTNARVVVQQSELDFALNPHPLDHRYFNDLLQVSVQGAY